MDVGDLTGLVAVVLGVGGIFIGLPWIILHYVTKWKQAPKITSEDEKLLDELYMLARRLEDRVATVERIVAADHPDWKASVPLAEPDTYTPSARRN